MRVRRLALEDFRSYDHMEVEIGVGITAFVGANGAGKTNLLEAVHLAARGDSSRAGEDAEMVRWGATVGRVRVDLARATVRTSHGYAAGREPLGERRPDMRTSHGYAGAGEIEAAGREPLGERREDERRVEVVLFAPAEGERRRPRRWLLDGAGKRADDAIGEIKVVAFFPEDVQLLGEAPSARRRYLDAMIGQADRRHRTDTREYQRVIEQRNALLRSLREAGAVGMGSRGSEELSFWNEALCRLGGAIGERRAVAVRELRPAFARAIATFTAGGVLDLTYLAQVEGASAEERAAGYAQLVVEKAEREVWQGSTLVGPHREDLAMRSGEGRPLPAFASRGEHRSAVVSLKLAEAEWLCARGGDMPVFLLDDVLSELDPRRREALVAALPADAQVLVTAALPAGLPPALLAKATVREVTTDHVEDLRA